MTPTGARVQGYALDAAGDPTGGLVDITLDTAGLTRRCPPASS